MGCGGVLLFINEYGGSTGYIGTVEWQCEDGVEGKGREGGYLDS